MAEAINAQNINDYLLYLADRLKQPLPAPYNNGASFNGKSANEIAAALEALYDRLGIPRQTGWSYEDAFLKEPPKITTPVMIVNPTAPISNAPAYSYYPVAPGIGRANFKPFLHWVEERVRRPLELFGITAWDHYSDDAIRQALPNVYRSSNITPDEAKQLELGFLSVYHQKVAPVPVQIPAMPASLVSNNTPPSAQATYATVKQPKSMIRKLMVPAILLIILGAAGVWLWQQYHAYMNLPTVYALTNNIALREDPSDTSPVLGRMDIYGTYLDSKNVKQNSASQLKLSTGELTNGFYKATSSNNFWSYLAGNDSTLYVHTKYVTTDKALFEKYSDDLDNFKNDYNELDKLGFIYRQMIGRAVLKNSEGKVLKIAASCKPSPRLSRVAPLSIGKYRNKITGELDVIIQATDGFCYVLRGGENELPPTITPVTIMYGTVSEPMKAGGMFARQGNGNTLRFEYCSDGQVFFSQPPYTLFMPLPASIPIPPPADDDADTVPMDTTAAGVY